uniref:AAA+ ATPase domain-containing protein n=1 Tax=Daucus carota subsp. sativus TaxID=79200 RepID=A0A165Z128_DAUCS
MPFCFISQFALRSYLYILFHKLVGWPASGWYGWREEEKFRVFYAVRIFLGLLSVITEATLVVALSRKYGKRLGCYTLAMLCLTSGCFFASTSFLPSSFSMYAISLSSALYLLDRPAMAVAVAATGTILGWPFSILAFLPVTVYSLIKKFKQAFLSGLITSVVVTVLSILVDHHFYKKWTSSVLNLLVYNVVGGGESHLYGTEGPLFYLKNGFNNFNFSFVLALLFLGILPITRKKYAPDLLVVISPMYIWIAFMSLQPHKEERFLYPIYPLVCIAASAVIDSFPDLFRDKYSSNDNSLLVTAAKFLRPFILGVILCCSHARTFSLIHGYSAPIEIYKHLEHYDNGRQDAVVCVGSEWHRYPSSFFIPDYVGQVRWINDGFRGLLPFPFNSTLGGTSAAPSYFNDKNKASEEQYLQEIERCDFLVELQLQRPYPVRGSDLSTWEGTLTSEVQVILHPLALGAEEYLWHIQATQENTQSLEVFEHMPSAQSVISVLAPIAATAMFVRSMSYDLFPYVLNEYMSSKFYKFFRSFSSEFTIVIEEFRGFSRNQVFEAADIYLATKVTSSTHRVKLGKSESEKNVAITVDKDEEVFDSFQDILVKWKLISTEVKSSSRQSPGQHLRDLNATLRSEVRSYELSFHKKHKEKVLTVYLAHVLETSKAIKQETKGIKIRKAEYGGIWNSEDTNLDHPMTFENLAMDSNLKNEIIKDLETFKKGKHFYKRIGRAWKRGYLLYGPPGTGKSSLIAAIANYLNFDIYDLDLTELESNSDLKRLLLTLSSQSILVIEDIDCSIRLQNRNSEDDPDVNKEDKLMKNTDPNISIRNLLRFLKKKVEAQGSAKTKVGQHLAGLDVMKKRRFRTKFVFYVCHISLITLYSIDRSSIAIAVAAIRTILGWPGFPTSYNLPPD